VSSITSNRDASDVRLVGAHLHYTPRAPLVRVGCSVEGRPIEAYLRGVAGQPITIVFGAFHGDEPKSAYVAYRLIDVLEDDASHSSHRGWVVVPVVNPDGLARRLRRNAHKVDLNRNFPTADWCAGKKHNRMYGGAASASEPETRAVMELIEAHVPARIVTIHSIGLNRFCNNYDGPASDWAGRMARINGYPITESIGYPTPGSFGTWAGIERQIPTITLELPSHHSAKRCWRDNREALLVR